jgi:hypothetical protein
MALFGGRPWFKAKRFGFGAGLPITWQGWAVLAVFLAAIFANGLLLHGRMRAAVIALLVAALALICAVKTEDGWRWRWP